MKRILLLAVVAALGCTAPDDSSPEGAFARLATCVDGADSKCLYYRLDRESQWSVQTIHRVLGEIGAIADKSYPAALRPRAFGRWQDAASAQKPAGVFEQYCRRTGCLEKVTRGFGSPVKRTDLGPGKVLLETTRGQQYPMNGADGRWGLGLFTESLQIEKIRILDRRAQVQKDGTAFKEQAMASDVE